MLERVYTMDVQYPLMVVGTAERHIQVLNLNNPTTVFKVRQLVFSYVRVDPNYFRSDDYLAAQVANTSSSLLSGR